VVEGAQLPSHSIEGELTKLSPRDAEIRLKAPVAVYSNLQLHVIGDDGADIPGALYGKIIEVVPGSNADVRIRFTSTSPATAFLRDQLAKAESTASIAT
jgi:hypothetical protein